MRNRSFYCPYEKSKGERKRKPEGTKFAVNQESQNSMGDEGKCGGEGISWRSEAKGKEEGCNTRNGRREGRHNNITKPVEKYQKYEGHQ